MTDQTAIAIQRIYHRLEAQQRELELLKQELAALLPETGPARRLEYLVDPVTGEKRRIKYKGRKP